MVYWVAEEGNKIESKILLSFGGEAWPEAQWIAKLTALAGNW